MVGKLCSRVLILTSLILVFRRAPVGTGFVSLNTQNCGSTHRTPLRTHTVRN